MQITDEVELAEIGSAANQQDKFGTAGGHIRAALLLLADRNHPDYRNVVKESISAIEGMGKVLTGTDKGTLDDALKALKKQPLYSPALLDGFRKIYGWSSDSDEGIRHSMKKESTLGYAEAKFFLIICSAFVNYLKTVGEINADEQDNNGEPS
ncbi:hypothetical protein ACFOLJ_28780 [Rugamonas sp. CCM 8940]|uniref:hypothetical protein n=1 Tax=Rugamonas sp. CCM 8940 TaxID=2765359 RepID=UPI0018F70C9B|nr:hypothetical protein [Rugamonas sp. CCM 8940]MBJ7313733.1 hypothetical protein [Rugamonas sp. CCM 8940]